MPAYLQISQDPDNDTCKGILTSELDLKGVGDGGKIS